MNKTIGFLVPSDIDSCLCSCAGKAADCFVLAVSNVELEGSAMTCIASFCLLTYASMTFTLYPILLQADLHKDMHRMLPF